MHTVQTSVANFKLESASTCGRVPDGTLIGRKSTTATAIYIINQEKLRCFLADREDIGLSRALMLYDMNKRLCARPNLVALEKGALKRMDDSGAASLFRDDEFSWHGRTRI